jgi:hypothetical protein
LAFISRIFGRFTFLYSRRRDAFAPSAHPNRQKGEVAKMVLCSIAIATGVLGAAAVMKRFIRHRFGGGPWALAACGPGVGGCGRGREGHGWSRRRWRNGFGPGQSFWLRALFARLDTTPGQEREIRAAIEEFQTTARDARGGLKDVREELAKSILGETFDEIAIGEASIRADATSSRIKDAVAGALKRVHGVLDPKQRERLAELLAKGPGLHRRGGGSPYRDAL